MPIIVTPEALNTSATKYRKELLFMAILGIGETLKHMTLRTGIRYEEVVGELSGAAELEPYKGTVPVEDDITIKGRTIATYLGQCVKTADPNVLISSIYGSNITSGKAIEQAEIVKSIIALIMARISKGLNKGIFNAVRNAAGTTTDTLFNGFDTINEADILSTALSVANKNYMILSEATTALNAVDTLKSIYFGASDELQAENSKLLIPASIYNYYNEDYKLTTGAIPYNTEFQKTFLEGSSNRCELVPLIGKAGSDKIQLTTKSNLLVGVNLMGDYEKIEVRRGDNPFKLQFISTMFFGTQFETISPELLMVAKTIIT